MGVVINFPSKGAAAKGSTVAPPARATAAPAPARSLKTERSRSTGFKIKAISLLLLKGVWASVWLVLAWLWLMGRWIAGIDLCFQLIRTAYFWNTPNVYAGWTFLLHFAVFTAWTYLVGVYRPAGFRDLPPVLAAKIRMTQSTSRLNVYRGRWYSYQPLAQSRSKKFAIGSLIKWRSHNEHRYQQYQKKVSHEGFVGKA